MNLYETTMRSRTAEVGRPHEEVSRTMKTRSIEDLGLSATGSLPNGSKERVGRCRRLYLPLQYRLD